MESLDQEKKEIPEVVLNDSKSCEILSKIATIERLLDTAGMYLSSFRIDNEHEDMICDIFESHRYTCSILKDLKVLFIEAKEKELGK